MSSSSLLQQADATTTVPAGDVAPTADGAPAASDRVRYLTMTDADQPPDFADRYLQFARTEYFLDAVENGIFGFGRHHWWAIPMVAISGVTLSSLAVLNLVHAGPSTVMHNVDTNVPTVLFIGLGSAVALWQSASVWMALSGGLCATDKKDADTGSADGAGPTVQDTRQVVQTSAGAAVGAAGQYSLRKSVQNDFGSVRVNLEARFNAGEDALTLNELTAMGGDAFVNGGTTEAAHYVVLFGALCLIGLGTWMLVGVRSIAGIMLAIHFCVLGIHFCFYVKAMMATEVRNARVIFSVGDIFHGVYLIGAGIAYIVELHMYLLGGACMLYAVIFLVLGIGFTLSWLDMLRETEELVADDMARYRSVFKSICADETEHAALQRLDATSAPLKGPPHKVRQEARRLSDVYSSARAFEPFAQAIVSDWAGKTGVKDFNANGKLKRLKRAASKVWRGYSGDTSQLTDVVRYSLIYDSVEEIASAMDVVCKDARATIIRVKNRLSLTYDDSKSAGYRDVLLNAQLDVTEQANTNPAIEATEELDQAARSHIFELQLHLRAMYNLKTDQGHKNYVQFRNGRAL